MDGRVVAEHVAHLYRESFFGGVTAQGDEVGVFLRARFVEVDVLTGLERGEGGSGGVFEGRFNDDHADGRVGKDLRFGQVFQSREGLRLLGGDLAGSDRFGEADDVIEIGQRAEGVHLAGRMRMRGADLGDPQTRFAFGGQQAREGSHGQAGEKGASVDHLRSQVAAAVLASVPSRCRVADRKRVWSFSPATHSGWVEPTQSRPGKSRYLAPPGRNIGSR